MYEKEDGVVPVLECLLGIYLKVYLMGFIVLPVLMILALLALVLSVDCLGSIGLTSLGEMVALVFVCLG